MNLRVRRVTGLSLSAMVVDGLFWENWLGGRETFWWWLSSFNKRGVKGYENSDQVTKLGPTLTKSASVRFFEWSILDLVGNVT